MEHMHDDVSTLTVKKFLGPSGKMNPEKGITTLIETAEFLRKNKIATDRSYSEAFFESLKHYIG